MIVLLLACAPLSWEDVRSACGLSAGESRPVAWHSDEGGEPLSRECAEGLGQAFRLDWDQLETTVDEARDPSYDASALLGGLYTFIAADVGTVGELRSSIGAAELAASDPDMGTLLQSYGDDEPAARFYFDYEQSVVEEIVLADIKGGPLLMASAFGRVKIDPDWLYPPDDAAILPFIRGGASTAAGVAHEAAHYAPTNVGHIEEYSPGCYVDAGVGGSYAVQARWLWSWEAHAGPEATDVDRRYASGNRNDACAHIVDYGGFEPCADAVSGLCDPASGVTSIP